MTSLTVTADELDAVARRLGGSRFPGVAGSLFDTIEPEHHQALTGRLLATLQARGLVAERDGRLVATPEAALLLAPALRGHVRYEIDRAEPDHQHTTALGELDRAVVWHRADGPYHRFDLLDRNGDVAGVLASLVDASPGPPTHRSRAFRSRRARLVAAGERPNLVPDAFAAIAEGWRATTTIRQAAAPAGIPSMSWLSIIDGGPGRVWMIEPDPDSLDDGLFDGDDPLVQATPVGFADLTRRLLEWCGCVLPS